MLGAKLKRARQRHKLSQHQLAALADVPQPVISRLESGKESNPTIEVAKRLARVLGVGIDYLAGTWDEEESPASEAAAPR